MFSVTHTIRARTLSAMPGPSPRVFDLGALFGRIERLEARRRRWIGAVAVAPARPDVELLADGAAFEAAWSAEVAALIAFKRRNTPQAEAAVGAARAATARLAARIESARPAGLEGLKVKARAQLWRRNGEPSRPVSSHRASATFATPGVVWA